MGATERHAILLAILLGEDGTTPRWERRVTQLVVDGEEVRNETVITHTYNS